MCLQHPFVGSRMRLMRLPPKVGLIPHSLTSPRLTLDSKKKGRRSLAVPLLCRMHARETRTSMCCVHVAPQKKNITDHQWKQDYLSKARPSLSLACKADEAAVHVCMCEKGWKSEYVCSRNRNRAIIDARSSSTDATSSLHPGSCNLHAMHTERLRSVLFRSRMMDHRAKRSRAEPENSLSERVARQRSSLFHSFASGEGKREKDLSDETATAAATAAPTTAATSAATAKH